MVRYTPPGASVLTLHYLDDPEMQVDTILRPPATTDPTPAANPPPADADARPAPKRKIPFGVVQLQTLLNPQGQTSIPETSFIRVNPSTENLKGTHRNTAPPGPSSAWPEATSY